MRKVLDPVHICKRENLFSTFVHTQTEHQVTEFVKNNLPSFSLFGVRSCARNPLFTLQMSLFIEISVYIWAWPYTHCEIINVCYKVPFLDNCRGATQQKGEPITPLVETETKLNTPPPPRPAPPQMFHSDTAKKKTFM